MHRPWGVQELCCWGVTWMSVEVIANFLKLLVVGLASQAFGFQFMVTANCQRHPREMVGIVSNFGSYLGKPSL